MIKSKISKKTCYLMGVVAGVLYAITGLVAMFNQSGYTFLYLSAFAFTGAMLLFTTMTEAGPENIRRRLQILGIFFVLLLAYMNLPPLSTLAGALVLPIFLRLYLENGRIVLMALTAVELLYFALQTLALVYSVLLYAIGPALIAVGIARALAAYKLVQQENNKKVMPGGKTAP